MLGMDRVSVQRLLRLELAVQHHIAGVVHPAAVHTDFQVPQPRYTPGETVKAAPQQLDVAALLFRAFARQIPHHNRSEEHTSELQSLMRISYAVFCCKKKQQNKYKPKNTS